jgi:uncharacterized protein
MGLLSLFFTNGLHSAVQSGDTAKIKELLTGGMDPNERRGNRTPLMIAARSANADAVACLIDQGAELEAQDSQGSTALMFAAGGWAYTGKGKEEKCLEVVDTLLERGADPNACGNRGQTAMRYALGAGNKRVMEVLRRHGATDSCYAYVDGSRFQ